MLLGPTRGSSTSIYRRGWRSCLWISRPRAIRRFFFSSHLLSLRSLRSLRSYFPTAKNQGRCPKTKPASLHISQKKNEKKVTTVVMIQMNGNNRQPPEWGLPNSTGYTRGGRTYSRRPRQRGWQPLPPRQPGTIFNTEDQPSSSVCCCCCWASWAMTPHI